MRNSKQQRKRIQHLKRANLWYPPTEEEIIEARNGLDEPSRTDVVSIEVIITRNFNFRFHRPAEENVDYVKIPFQKMLSGNRSVQFLVWVCKLNKKMYF